MELYLLRHAIAVQRGTEGYDHDSDRPLTPKGAKKMRRIAQGMLALELSFDIILSSPYLRAKETAEIVAAVFHEQKQLKFTDNLAATANEEDLVKELKKEYTSFNSILLVGHEPFLSSLVSKLIAGVDTVAITLKKGGLCKLTVESMTFGRCATLEWLLAPTHLTRIS